MVFIADETLRSYSAKEKRVTTMRIIHCLVW